MKGYGQFCSIAMAATILAERWTLLVVRELLLGSSRFNDIQRGLPLMSPTLLSKRLRELEDAGLLKRVGCPDSHGWEYRLTPAGEELRPLVEGLGRWGQKWARSSLGPQDLDVGMLMWDMRRFLRPAGLPTGRTVIYVEFADLARHRRRWWLLCNAGQVDLCLQDPGFEADVYVYTDLRTLAEVFSGAVPLRQAMASPRMKLVGPGRLLRTVARWFPRSPFADIPDARLHGQGGME